MPTYGSSARRRIDRVVNTDGTCSRRVCSGSHGASVDLFLHGDAWAERALRGLKSRLVDVRFECVEYVVAALDVMLAVPKRSLARSPEDLAGAVSCVRANRSATRMPRAGTARNWSRSAGTRAGPRRSCRWSPTWRTRRLWPNRTTVSSPLSLLSPRPLGTPANPQAALAHLRRGGLAAIRQSSTWMVSVAGAIEAAALLGDDETAREGYAVLLHPFADYPVMASLAVVCFGSAHRVRGRARADVRRRGSRDQSLRGGGGRRPPARQSTRGRAQLRTARSRARLLRHVTRRRSCFVRPAWTVGCAETGNVWRVMAGARTFTVVHSVGMAYLAHLLAQPGMQIRAVDLASEHGFAPLASLHAVLDDKAIAAVPAPRLGAAMRDRGGRSLRRPRTRWRGAAPSSTASSTS